MKPVPSGAGFLFGVTRISWWRLCAARLPRKAVHKFLDSENLRKTELGVEFTKSEQDHGLERLCIDFD
jgi:hypothetical protein